MISHLSSTKPYGLKVLFHPFTTQQMSSSMLHTPNGTLFLPTRKNNGNAR